MANSDRERRLREREQILREHRDAITRLSHQAALEVEKKYANLYGENWRQVLSCESASVIEENIIREKNMANGRIEELIVGLKSSESSDSMKLIRR